MQHKPACSKAKMQQLIGQHIKETKYVFVLFVMVFIFTL